MNSTRGAQSTKTALLDLFVPPEPEPKTAPNNGSGSPFEPGESSTASASKATGCVSPPLAPPLSPIHHRPSLVQRCRSDRSELAQPSTFDKIIDRDDDNNGTHSDTNTELTPLLTRKSALHPTSPVSISSTVLDGSVTPKTGSASRQKSPRGIERPIGILTGVTHCLPDLLPIQELAPSTENSTKKSSLGGFRNHAKGVSHKLTNSLSELHTMASNAVRYAAVESVSPSTWIGAFMFLLFSLVFSLTFGATIIRPHGSFPLIGIVSRMSALGIMFGAPIYWLQLPDAPALYPTVDLFAAPFLAKIAVLVDEELFRDPTVSDSNNDRVFMATFAFLASLSLALSGSLSMLASIFKVVNLGAFLPFPVLCGFFTAAGCLTWTLAFKVDTNGLSVQQVFLSGDKSLMWMSLVHHTPSVVVAAVMKYMGPKHPLYVVMSVLITIAMFYAIMFSSGTTMEEMILHNWFWSKSESHFKATSEQARFQWVGFESSMCD